MSLLLRQGQIDRMRLTVNRALPDELVIHRRARESDGGGGFRTAYLPDPDSIACRVSNPLGGETDVRQVSGTRLADEDMYTASIAAEVSISKLDRIEWEGRTFEVNEVLQRGNWELTRRVRIKEV